MHLTTMRLHSTQTHITFAQPNQNGQSVLALRLQAPTATLNVNQIHKLGHERVFRNELGQHNAGARKNCTHTLYIYLYQHRSRLQYEMMSNAILKKKNYP